MVTQKKVFFFFALLVALGISLPAAAQELLTYSSTTLVYTYYLDSSGNQILHGKRIQKDWTGLSKLEETDYSHGQINGYDKAWWDTGARRYERQYVNGVLNGKVMEWYYSQDLAVNCNYLNGKLHGLYQGYDSSYGNQVIECSYSQGMLHGPCQRWTTLRFSCPNQVPYYSHVHTEIGQYDYNKKYGTWYYYTYSTSGSNCPWYTETIKNEGSYSGSPPGGDNPDPLDPDKDKKEIRGRVFDEAEKIPLQGAVIQVGSYQDTSDANGFYSLKLDEADIYQVTCSKQGYYRYTSDINLKDSQSVTINITLKKSIDNRPAVTNVDSKYGRIFFDFVPLLDVSMENVYTAHIDWNGTTPGKVMFMANDQIIHETPVENTAGHTFSMSRDFKIGLNEELNILKVIAETDTNVMSEPFILHPIVIPLPGWSWGFKDYFTIKTATNGYVFSLAIKIPLREPMTILVNEERLGSTFWTLWGLVPYLGGEILGLKETQVFLDAEATTAERKGSVAAGGMTGFEAAGGTIAGKLGGKASLEYKPGEGLVWTESSIILGLEGKVEKEEGMVTVIPALKSAVEWPIVGGVIGWINAKGKGKATIKIGASLELVLGDTEGILGISKISPAEISGGAGLGMSGELIEGLEAELSGELNEKLTLQAPAAPDYFKKAEAELSAKLALKIWEFEYSIPAKTTFVYPDDADKEPSFISLSGNNVFPEFKQVSREFLTYEPYNNFEGGTKSLKNLQAVMAAGDVTENKLIANVYPYAEPAFAESSGKSAIAYVYFRPSDNTTDINFMYSDGGAYSAPAPIKSDTKFDFAPTIAFDSSGKVVAVWQQVNDSSFSGDITDMAEKMEIVWTVYNPSTKSWSSPAALTNNTYLDYGPVLKRGASGEPLLIWKSNEGNQLIGTDEYPTTIQYASWNGTGFNAPREIPEQFTCSFKFSLACTGTDAILAYMKDMDGDMATPDDEEIFYLNFNGTAWDNDSVRITSDQTPDASPQVLYCNGNPELLWLKGDDLVRLTDWNSKDYETIRQGSASLTFTDFKALCDPSGSLVLLWQDSDRQYSEAEAKDITWADLYYSVYDSGSDVWSEDLQLTHDAPMEKNASGMFSSDGTLHLVYNKKDINSPAPVTDLYHLTYTLVKDIAIASDDLMITPDNASGGQLATLSCTVHNSGDLALTDVKVAFYLGNPSAGGVLIGNANVTPSLLKAGSEGESTIQWTIPSPVTTRTVYILVDPDNAVAESNESNNMASFNAVHLDIEATGCTAIKNVNGTYDIVGVIKNTGAVPASTVAVQFKADGAPIPSGTVTITNITEGISIEVTKNIWSDPTLKSFTPVLEVVVDPWDTIAEEREDNNNASAILYIDLVSPKFYDFGGLPVGSTSLSRIFTIANPVHKDLVIGQITLTGAYHDEFKVKNDTCSGKTLSPSSMCTMEIAFSPDSPYTKTASLPVPFNEDDYTLSIDLEGEGLKNCTDNSDCPDDGDICNGEEICSEEGKCTHGAPLVCNDSKPCTVDTCDPAAGCRYTPLPDGSSCSDSLFCNGQETCDNGTCASGNQPCGAGYTCNESADQCSEDTFSSTTTAVEPPPSGGGGNGGGGGVGGGGSASTTTTPQTATTTAQPATTTSAVSSTTTSAVQPPPASTSTTTSAPRLCPAEKLFENEYSNPVVSHVFETLRQFRDQRLAKSSTGKMLIALYYTHSSEVTGILSTDPVLQYQARQLILEMLPLLQVRGTVVLTREQQEKLCQLLTSLQRQSSPEFRRSITLVINTLESGELYRGTGVEIQN